MTFQTWAIASIAANVLIVWALSMALVAGLVVRKMNSAFTAKANEIASEAAQIANKPLVQAALVGEGVIKELGGYDEVRRKALGLFGRSGNGRPRHLQTASASQRGSIHLGNICTGSVSYRSGSGREEAAFRCGESASEEGRQSVGCIAKEEGPSSEEQAIFAAGGPAPKRPRTA